ncbi:transcriptional regulator [Acrocarpospora phusangensis]|uniref:Transcriptional regulator n=1 Tax=Acrocarpospora phusangensis TaxID=1070424 RepID=A0A919UI59_9ACTN|nr:IclR family transcriptional regulator [Acrocarpospora phusangensis]GIH22321.1 transcriptional regulator [Acrocarpospora phusangensis]
MGRTVPAVSRALDILELFLGGETLSAPQIAERLGLPRTTVHELVTTLTERSYLIGVPGQPTRYRLGMRLFQLGNVFADQLDLSQEALLVAREVAAACDETVHVAVLDGTDVVYITKVDSTHPVRMVSAVGRRLPAHCTGVGKMLLAGLTPEAFEARFPADRTLSAMTPDSITSPARLWSHLTEIRARGLSYDNCESNESVCCVAAPVYDQTGTMVAAMSVSVPILRWDSARREEWGELVARGAHTLSDRLGHRTDGHRPDALGPAG